MMKHLHRIAYCATSLVFVAACTLPVESQSIDLAAETGVGEPSGDLLAAGTPRGLALPCSLLRPEAIPQEWSVASQEDEYFLPSIHAEALLRERLQEPGGTLDRLPIVSYLASCPTPIAGEWWVLFECRLPSESHYRTLLVAITPDGETLRILGRPWSGVDLETSVLAQLQHPS